MSKYTLHFDDKCCLNCCNCGMEISEMEKDATHFLISGNDARTRWEEDTEYRTNFPRWEKCKEDNDE